MGSKGGFTLLGLLLIVSVLCHSGHGLQCYHCPNAIGLCNNAVNCSSNFDACLSLHTVLQNHYSCWKYGDCNPLHLLEQFGQNITFHCCQKDLCNRSGETSVTGTTVLLVTQLLAAFWRLFI
ncbi:CD59 glycoprotein [Pteronotus mesoamericanus]|uniref:CD59 glycoprotein n=1 Tax=Pteronotus mesoamericanus TaxID=1884717 RepID=UPI0023EA8450|nr:CD59 glycoprotein [Pteronotus parnellii mesoamericanus]